MQRKDKSPPQREAVDKTAGKPKKDRGGWSAKELGEQASYKSEDEIRRRMRRGDETQGDPDERDAAGAPRSIDTPHGREETKSDEPGAANQNG